MDDIKERARKTATEFVTRPHTFMVDDIAAVILEARAGGLHAAAAFARIDRQAAFAEVLDARADEYREAAAEVRRGE